MTRWTIFFLGVACAVGCRDQEAAVSSPQSADDLTTSAPSTPGADAPVVFTLPEGLGKGAWNKKETEIKLVVGQIFRVVNLDPSEKHTLHTLGDPCPHGGDRVYDAQGQKLTEGFNTDAIPLGGWLECDVKTAFPSNEDDLIYDHYQFTGTGDAGKIYITVAPSAP